MNRVDVTREIDFPCRRFCRCSMCTSRTGQRTTIVLPSKNSPSWILLKIYEFTHTVRWAEGDRAGLPLARIRLAPGWLHRPTSIPKSYTSKRRSDSLMWHVALCRTKILENWKRKKRGLNDRRWACGARR